MRAMVAPAGRIRAVDSLGVEVAFPEVGVVFLADHLAGDAAGVAEADRR